MRSWENMSSFSKGRPEFRKWIDSKPDPGWALLPLTHMTKGLGAQDIIRDGRIRAAECNVLQAPSAYFFYGRPAYRVSGDGAIKIEAACPVCFVFQNALIETADAIYAFDTGAFAKRLYSRIVMEEMTIHDFSLGRDLRRPNRLIAHVFRSHEAYFNGDTTKILPPEEGAEAWEFHARAYLDLLASPGRNEPDDRVCSIEVVFGADVPIVPNLKALVVPHTLWDTNKKAPWLRDLEAHDVDVLPYVFLPGRHPEHYQTQVETVVRDLYRKWSIL